MTTDPATAPAEQVPTREEIARKLCRLPGSLCIGFCHRQNCQEAIAVYGDAADAIIALYAPALARLEKERDEALAENMRWLQSHAGHVYVKDAVWADAWDKIRALKARAERAEAEKEEAQTRAAKAEEERDEARDAPWPEWTVRCLKLARERSGYDGYDDQTDGVDLPEELEETLIELESQAERWKARALTAEAALATAEAEGMRKAAGIAKGITSRRFTKDMRELAKLIDAAILAAIPKEK